MNKKESEVRRMSDSKGLRVKEQENTVSQFRMKFYWRYW